MSPHVEDVLNRLDALRQKWWLFSLLTTCVLALSLSLSLFLVFLGGDAQWRFSQSTLVGLLGVWMAVTLGLMLLVGRRLLRSQRDLAATARRVEMELPELGNQLINLVQLSESPAGDPVFCAAAVDQAALEVEKVDFGAASSKESRLRRFFYCMQTPRDLVESILLLGVVVFAGVMASHMLPNWGSAASRLFSPWSFVPSVGSVGTIEVDPGDTQVMIGSNVQISASIVNPTKKVYDGRFYYRTGEESVETCVPLLVDAEGEKYRTLLPAILKPVGYRVEIGDSQSKAYRIEVLEKPVVAEVEVTYHYPPYLHRPDKVVQQKTADLEVPQHTTALLRIRPNVPVAKGYIECDKQEYYGKVADDGESFLVELPMARSTTFTVHLVHSTGQFDSEPRLNRMQVLEDGMPSVELLEPARETTSAPGRSIPVVIRARDEYGLSALRLEMKLRDGEDQNESPEVVQRFSDLNHSTDALRKFSMELKEAEVKPGDIVLIRAVASDNRSIQVWGNDLRPQEVSSGWHSIRINDRGDEEKASLELIEATRNALMRIYEKQTHALAFLSGMDLSGEESGEARLAGFGQVREEQIGIQKMTVDLVEKLSGAKSESERKMKQVLNGLAYGKMLKVVQGCDTILKRSDETLSKRVEGLVAEQGEILDILRKLLDIARHLQDETLAEMSKRPGGDLPDDVRRTLEEAKSKLEEFLEQQKKVIEATKDLAKTPVDDFTKEQEQELKALAASQDDWAKFMEDLHSDLSKLPEQDFSNTSMLKETVEIQTEIKMAEDALLKKSVDIAVPLEQLGYERAEELMTNLEKWLPDSPDREKWSQEESLTDKDKEAPMAELPSELEDLVGELMEEEEDLFDEMEDISSSAMDSLDKAAGWDALDGPISNMSAKGVTGNRLPNSSEIGGRAGEGRQGKSSGEFVGDEAVGKGGRKTPSRLTPDAFTEGQIKDHSKEPTGGSTGGGKESGQGGEGLEGPQRRSPGEREMQRLAGKQAALRNKAEGIDLQMEVSNYHHTDLKKMIEVMAQIERDLKSGRYQNALRQRGVLVEGLGNVKQNLNGEFEVKQDQTINLPSEVQKEILSGMRDPSPSGWEEWNRRYYERLSTGGE